MSKPCLPQLGHASKTMTISICLLRALVIVGTISGSSAVREPDSSCNAGELARTLESRKFESKELLRICRERYSEGICNAAGRALAVSLRGKLRQGTVSTGQLALLACGAVEDTMAQQRALLLRQGRVEMPIPSSAAIGDSHSTFHTVAHGISDIAASISDNLRSSMLTSIQSLKPSKSSPPHTSLDSGLNHKGILFPHGRFNWEYSSGGNSSNSSSLAAKVDKWILAHHSKVNKTSPDVKNRVAAFTSFVTTSTKPKAKKKTKSGALQIREATEVDRLLEELEHLRPTIAGEVNSSTREKSPLKATPLDTEASELAQLTSDELRKRAQLASEELRKRALKLGSSTEGVKNEVQAQDANNSLATLVVPQHKSESEKVAKEKAKANVQVELHPTLQQHQVQSVTSQMVQLAANTNSTEYEKPVDYSNMPKAKTVEALVASSKKSEKDSSVFDRAANTKGSLRPAFLMTSIVRTANAAEKTKRVISGRLRATAKAGQKAVPTVDIAISELDSLVDEVMHN